MAGKVPCSGTCEEHRIFCSAYLPVFRYFQICRRRDSNPHASRRHPLKMVCLPIPPLRRGLDLLRTYFFSGAGAAGVLCCSWVCAGCCCCCCCCCCCSCCCCCCCFCCCSCCCCSCCLRARRALRRRVSASRFFWPLR